MGGGQLEDIKQKTTSAPHVHDALETAASVNYESKSSRQQREPELIPPDASACTSSPLPPHTHIHPQRAGVQPWLQGSAAASFCLRLRSRLQAEHIPSDSYYDSHFVLTHLSVSHHRQSGGWGGMGERRRQRKPKTISTCRGDYVSKPPGLNI